METCNETCNMNAFFSFDLFMVYIPECKQQLRTKKKYIQIQDIAHFKSGFPCNNQ